MNISMAQSSAHSSSNLHHICGNMLPHHIALVHKTHEKKSRGSFGVASVDGSCDDLIKRQGYMIVKHQ